MLIPFLISVHVVTVVLWIGGVAFPKQAQAEVVFHDDIAAAGKAVTLKAETKGKFFRKGGELVEFFVDGKSIGSVLSGGDGFAYRNFTPSKTGLIRIKVKSGKDRAEGFILSLKKDAGIVFIDVEGSLMESPLSKKPMEGSIEAVKKIIKRFPVAYIRTLMPSNSLKEWLSMKNFPPAPLLETPALAEAEEKALKVKAVIGNAGVVSLIKDRKTKKYSFDETEDAEEVASWKEITDSLR